MKLLLVIVLMAALLLPSAYGAEYWVVVPEDGTALDVINAANFAASMKGSVGVTFESRMDEDIRGDSEDLDDHVIVLLEGESATILLGTDPDFQAVVDNAEVYLEREGYTVEIEQAGHETLEEAIGEAKDDETLPQPEGEPEFVQELPDPEGEVVETPPPPVEGQIDPPSLEIDVGPEDTGEQTDEPGFFAKIWRWFTSIFS